jgi:hypothetical protein
MGQSWALCRAVGESFCGTWALSVPVSDTQLWACVGPLIAELYRLVSVKTGSTNCLPTSPGRCASPHNTQHSRSMPGSQACAPQLLQRRPGG